MNEVTAVPHECLGFTVNCEMLQVRFAQVTFLLSCSGKSRDVTETYNMSLQERESMVASFSAWCNTGLKLQNTSFKLKC